MNFLRLALMLCAVLFSVPGHAQETPAPDAAPLPPTASLDITLTEREYFELGVSLARGTFAYTPLGSASAGIERSHTRAKVGALGRLAPEAAREREMARLSFTRAAQLLQSLHAPLSVLSPVTRLAAHLAKPLPLTDDARSIVTLNKDAAQVLSALSESQLISQVMEDKALARWLNVPSEQRIGPVWYAEGVLTGVADIAAAHHLPELLPPVADMATDLRGLRDWLALRVPENPTPDLATLQANIAVFLQEVSLQTGKPIAGRSLSVTDTQLALLGEISRGLQAQILLPGTQ